MIDLDDLMDEAADLPYGEAKTLLLEQALRQAETGGDRGQVLTVRMELTEAYQFGSEPAKSFATFSRCVADYDADPGLFDDWQTHTLLWQYKWIVDSMRDFPQIPLSRAHDALAEMERRYRAAGVGLHAVHAQRCAVAEHVGDRAAAEEHFHRWSTTPRDEMSDCEGCDPDGKVVHLAWTGRDEEAVELAAPVVAGHLTCENQPQSILSCLLLPYVRTGRHAEAAQAHLKAYRLIQALPHYTSDLDLHLEFLARTGNEHRGLEILQRELPRLEERAAPHTLMTFLSAAGLLLRRLEETGHGGLPVGQTTVAALRDDTTRRARELAAAFDARNGTGEQSARVEARLAAEPLAEHLPLVPHARRTTLPGTARPPAQAAPHETPEQLLDTAEDAWRRGEHAAALAAWERYDEAGGEPGGRRTDGHGLAAAAQGDLETAAKHWEHAAELHRRAGDESRRQASRGRAAMAGPDGLAVVEETSRYLLAHGAPGQRPAALSRLAQAYVTAGRRQEALDLLAGAEDGMLLFLRARMEDPVTAAATLPLARAALRAEGVHVQLADAALAHGELLRRLAADGLAEPDPEEVTGAYAEAAAVTANPEQRAVALAVRGELLVAAGREEEAAEDLIEAVALFTALSSTGNAALARVDLAAAYLATDRPVEAAITAEEALGLLDPDDYDNRVNVQWLRACARRALGEMEAALADFTELAGRYAEPLRVARARESAAVILSDLDRDDEAAAGFRDAVEAYLAAGARDEAGAAMRRQLSALHWSGKTAAALEAVEPVREFLRTLDGPDAPFERAALDYDEARMLLSQERGEEAAERAGQAAAAFTALGLPDLAEAATDLLGYI
ncbi:hypothetical protein [Nonomuraea typhae]|uniref:hypothetical protein n=1 Tax=Nonomuraea typhae TaxID=2603600 RepID=UPI0012FCDF12|nr:hypothetical protein [Nonomuraea typhae]